MIRAAWLPAVMLLATNLWAELDLYQIKPKSLAHCDELVGDHPGDLEAWRCYGVVANIRGQRPEAIRKLERHLALDPGNDRARTMLGTLKAHEWNEEAEALFRQAIEGFEAKGDRAGEVHARISLYFWLNQQLRLAEATPLLGPAEEAARAAGDAGLQALVLYHRGLDAHTRGDLGQALEVYRRVETMVFPHGRPYLQSFVANALGVVYFGLGRFREAMDAFRRAAEVDRRTKDYWDEATKRLNMAEAGARLAARGELAQDEWRRLIDEARASAERSGNRRAEASLHQMLAEDQTLTFEQRLSEGHAALALTRQAGLLRNASEILCLLARLHLENDPKDVEAPLRLADEAIRLSTRSSPADTATGLLTRAWVHERVGDRPAAISDRLAGLELIERMRDLQRDDLLRSHLFSQWAFAYYDLIDVLLEPAGSQPATAHLALAFSVAERLRARALLDALDAAGASARIGAGASGHAPRVALLGRIALLQRRLLASVEEGERKRLLGEIERLEDHEEALRDAIARGDPRFGALRRPVVPSLADVEQALDPDQALLSYQSGGSGTGPTSLFVVTRENARVFALSDRATIEAAAMQFLGLLEWRDGSELKGSVRLHQLLLGDALETLPGGIERLVVVPDGILHRLPFDALRPGPDAEPVGARFEVSIAPSAAVWLRLRRAGGGGADNAMPALALADPELLAQGEPAVFRDAAPWAEPLRLGRLVHARAEARSLAWHLGRGSRLLLGPEASERAFKTMAGTGFRVLHLAAHAVTDDDTPERSAVLLAPGADEEDGLLQIREIVDLELSGPVVILSACRSASGVVRAGEGVMGLARAFLQAGSVAVVGSLWPLRDDEAATLVDGLARGLGSGSSVGHALAVVRRERAEAGAPTAAWAGLVVIGDGDFVPIPGGAALSASRAIPAVGALTVALTATLVVRRLRRRVRPFRG
jgi:CHAT domain-containing protein/tetratricopeptide (TPR) repeat protein